MTVIATELISYGCANLPANDVDTLGGAIDTGNEIAAAGGTLGALFTKRSANAYSGADKICYTKCFLKNTNATDDLNSAVIWIDNMLISPAADGIISAVSDSESDDSSKYLKYIFERPDGTYMTENVEMNGTSAVTSIAQIGAATMIKVELRNTISNELINAAGEITISRGSILGKIPRPDAEGIGCNCANGHVAIGLEANLDDSNTTANRVTAPGGISFDATANTKANGLAVANSGVLTTGTAQGIWLQETLPDGMFSSSDIYCSLMIEGEDA